MPSKIVTKMILREIAAPFFFSLVAMSLLFLVGKLFTQLEPLLAAGISLGEFLRLNMLMLPIFLYILIPICTLLGVLIAFIRLTRDSEIVALFACGVGPNKILFPVALVAVTAMVVGLVVSAAVVPYAKRQTSLFMDRITEKALSRGLPEKRFFTPIKGLTFFVDKRLDNGHHYKGVFIRDARSNKIAYSILAQRGELSTQPETGRIALILWHGRLLRVGQHYNFVDTIGFEKYILSLSSTPETSKKRRGQMTTWELYKAANQPNITRNDSIKYLIEFHKRLGIPFGALIMGLLAAPLGIFFGRGGISAGICAGLIGFLAYYLTILLGTSLAEDGTLTPALGVWLPNGLFLVITLFAYRSLYTRGPMR